MRVFVLVAAATLTASPALAQRLPSTVRPTHYDLAFAIDLAHERFDGTETIQVEVEEPTSHIVLNALEITFRDVTIGTGASAQAATVTLDENAQSATLAVRNMLPRGPSTIQIRYAGVLSTNLRGFYISKTKARKYAVTQFESTDARRAFPCFDEPAFKATFAVTLTLDRGDSAISNGKVLSDTPGPGVTQHTMKFATSPRMSSYLVAMAVGDFKCLEGAADAIPIRICATPDKTDFGRIALDSAQQVLKFYNTYYAIKYPFVKLDIVAVPDFAAGAMENTAAIFYRETDLLADSKSASVATRKTIASILAHEMAHQWFGDLVTMEWWDDIWLNEGFATWMANKPLAAARADWNIAVDETEESRSALNLDALKSTRPIHADVSTPAQIDEAFDGIAYEKGAAVLRMVENYVGPEAFRTGINAYLQAHAYKNAASEDLWKAIAAASGKPVERILPTFVNQPGVPLLEVSSTCVNDRTTVTLTQRRFFSNSASTDDGRWQIPVCLKRAGQSSPACEVLTEASRAITLSGACSPWIFANAGARGYYRTAYSSDLLRGIAPHVETDLTASERLMLLDDEWAMVRAGRHTVGDYLTLLSGYGNEHTSGVLQEATSRLGFIDAYLTTDATRTAFEHFASGLLRPLFDDVGLTTAASDPDERRALRATIIAALGGVGNDPEVVSKARSALDRALAGGPALDPTTATSVIPTAAAHGDATLFDALAAAADRATSPEDQYRYLYALADFRDPALIDRGLQRVLSPQIRNQDAAIYLGHFFGNPAARTRAWTFLTERWAELAPKVGIFGGDTNLVRAVSGFCDTHSRDAVIDFFARHPLPAASRTLEQTLEQINSCIGMRESHTSAVTAWLAGR